MEELHPTFCPPSTEVRLQYIDYSEHATIKRLLANYHHLRIQAEHSMNTELLCICIDLERALDSIPLTYNETKILTMFVRGYTLQDIERAMDRPHQYIHKALTTCCKVISHYLTSPVKVVHRKTPHIYEDRPIGGIYQ